MPRFLFVLGVVLALAAPAVVASDGLAWAKVTGPIQPSVQAAPDYQVFVDGAARTLAEAGLPVASTEGAPVLEVGSATIPVDPAARPGAVSVETPAFEPAVVLPDGFSLPASFPSTGLALGVASDGHDTISIGKGTAAKAAPASGASGSSASSPSVGSGSVAPYVGSGGASAPAMRAGTTPTGGSDAYTPKAVVAPSGSSYAPSAVALSPVEGSDAANAAAAGALAIGVLLSLWPLYHRLRGHETLESATRKRIYDVVCARPGAGVAEVALKGGVSYSTATYHLERLVEAGMLVASSEGAKLRYYKNGGFNEDDRKLVPLLENAEVMRLLGLIRANPGTYRAALADALNVTTTTINWHLKRLTAAGLVREERKGRSAHLYAVEERLANLPALGSRLQVETTEGAAAMN